MAANTGLIKEREAIADWMSNRSVSTVALLGRCTRSTRLAKELGLQIISEATTPGLSHVLKYDSKGENITTGFDPLF